VSDTAPLAALLASHPEECAAVVAVLCVSGDDPATAQNVCFYLRHQVKRELSYEVVSGLLVAMQGAEVVTVSRREGDPKTYFVLVAADRYSIARMGAAAWLRARCGGEAVAP
jgi:hypothetical protein